MDRLTDLAFEAVCIPCGDYDYSIFHAACIEQDTNTCKTVLWCSPSKMDTALALKCTVRNSACCSYSGFTAKDIVKNNKALSLLHIIEKAERNALAGLSLIHETARRGSLRQVKTIFKNTVRENIDKPSPLRDDDHATPLLLAARFNSCKVVRFLVENRANKDAKDWMGRGALHYAAMGGKEATVSYLLSVGILVDYKTTWGKTALHIAAMKGYGAVVSILVQSGADLESSTGFGDTPLLLAAEEGNIDCVKVLAHSGSNINVSNMAHYTPLHNAAKEGHHVTVKFLVQHGSRVDAVSSCGETPLSLAVRKKHGKEAVALLLHYGSSVNLRDLCGRTALHYCVDRDVAVLLVQKGADLHAADNEGKTPLFLAALGGYEGVADLLINQGSSVNAASKSGDTALHEAAIRGHTNTAQVLLKYGANINARTVTGETPLSLAVITSKVRMIQLLLSLGADYGYTP